MTDDGAFERKNQLDISQTASTEIGVSHIENTPAEQAGAWTNERVARLQAL